MKKVRIDTKSNYRNLNGKVLEVKEEIGTRVSCDIVDECGRTLTADFSRSEVEFVDE